MFVVLALLAVHAACYVLSNARVAEQATNVEELDEAGDAADWLHWVTLHQQVLLLLSQNRSAPGEVLAGVQCTALL
jgi:hypothetical protein